MVSGGQQYTIPDASLLLAQISKLLLDIKLLLWFCFHHFFALAKLLTFNCRQSLKHSILVQRCTEFALGDVVLSLQLGKALLSTLQHFNLLT